MKSNTFFKAIAIAFVATILAVSCKTNGELNGDWTVSSLTGADVASADEQPYFKIDLSNGTYAGYTGVNVINGKIKTNGGKISFADGAMTKMMGSPESMVVEDTFVSVLREIKSFEVQDESTIILKNASGETVMTLVRKAE